jgi:3-oxoacyl-[acyl-carrier protein] reductase
MPTTDPNRTELSGPLHGLNVVVTGASGGIGRQTAIAVGSAGADRVVVHYASNRSAAEETARLVGSVGGRASLAQADCGRSSECRRLVDEAFDAVGVVDVWIHAAGADVLTGMAAGWDFERKLRHLIDVDLIGSMNVGRAYAERMRAIAEERAGRSAGETSRPPASLVLIGWDQATEGMEGDAGQMFGPVKAAVEAFAKSLAQEYAAAVRVNTIAPGWIRTAWGESVQGYWDQRARGQSLMRRWGTAADVAAAAVFLASPASGFITGQTIAVNGGFSRRFERIEP